ncbi:signal recognition particle receptor subunit alpha, partial [Mycobacterium tuberculosis]|nr:signal recognition particle receptor subunit alpha [Mycobacterium tuberculosis]
MSEKPGWREKLFGGFKKTSSKLTENLTGLITKGKLDAETLDDIEEALIVSDLGPATA